MAIVDSRIRYLRLIEKRRQLLFFCSASGSGGDAGGRG